MSRNKLALGLVALVLVASSCTKSNEGSETVSPKTDGAKETTTTVAEAAPYASVGPDEVGFTDLELADGRRVVVWYPTTASAIEGKERERIDIAGFLNPELQAKIPAADRSIYLVNAFKDAKPRAEQGGYPVVLFSHGYAGFPEQSASLTTHLASWGYVVAAPEHVERSLGGMLGTAAQGVAKSTDPEVLSATLDLLEAQSGSGASLLSGTVDPTRVAVTGHSAGAAAAFKTAATDPRIDGWISYSVGFGGTGDRAMPTPPSLPGMVQMGTKDGVIPPALSESTFAAMNSPKYLVTITGAGHLVFSDICLMGAEKGGIVNIAKTLELPIPEELLKLGTDGCGAEFPPTDEAFPSIDQTSVAFLRWVFGQDKEPVGLSTDALADLGADVTVTKG